LNTIGPHNYITTFMPLDTIEKAQFKDYLSKQPSYNELLDKNGNIHNHWKEFFEAYKDLGNKEFTNRNQYLQKLLRENGVTYNVYGDPSGQSRIWHLDPIPFLISQNEWQRVESGLKQRAHLLDLIFKDIYGENKLIKNGLLPAELIYNHAGYLRECAGIPFKNKHGLILYSADVARSPDGNIWVLNDRTQAPSGSGYSQENRTAMSQIFPEFFNKVKIKRLSSYFTTLRNTLNSIAPPSTKHPRVVLLTPGPRNETYFEHSYLSSHLGISLVQGQDLMVKDNFVWIRTIEGLEKVDVIIRRVDDIYCDPLELKEDSQLGIPGLLQVIRAGNVSLANPLGCSILENPGLLPFLQNISHYFTGEDLILPTLASWWCGQPRELKYVLDNLSSLVIRRIYRDTATSSSIDASSLSSAGLKELKEQIKMKPYLYIGQEKILFSSVPSYVNGTIEPRNVMFRSFLVSNNGTYEAMPGGLTRISSDVRSFIISNQAGGLSKDTWIISDPDKPEEPVKEILTENRHQHIDALPSRTAENLFWVGRYADRILANARYIRAVIQYINSKGGISTDQDKYTEAILLKGLTHYTCTYPGFTSEQTLLAPWNELFDLFLNEERIGGLKYNVSMILRSADAVRDYWSADTWRILKSLEESWENQETLMNRHKLISSMDNIITSMIAFIGLNRESISREYGWLLLDSGRKIEQCLLLITMLRSLLVQDHGASSQYDLMETFLSSNESLVNYRYTYKTHIQLPVVLDLMLFNPHNPHSLIYLLENLKVHLNELPQRDSAHDVHVHKKLVIEAITLLKNADPKELTKSDTVTKEYNCLDQLLSRLYSIIAAIPFEISSTYFKHAQSQKQLFASDIA